MLSLFSIIVFTTILTISIISIEDEYIIHKTYGTSFEKIAFNINFIKKYPDRINGSIVFLGPSVVNEGICDSTLSVNGIKAINLGINHPSHEVDLYFSKRVLEFHPKRIVFNANFFDFDWSLHSLTPLLYNPFELRMIGQNFNHHFIMFFFKRITFCLDYLIWNIFEKDDKEYDFNKYGITRMKVMDQSRFNKLTEMKEVINLENINNSKSIKDNLVKFILVANKIKNDFIHSTFREPLYNSNSAISFKRNKISICRINRTPFSILYIPILSNSFNSNPHFNFSYINEADVLFLSNYSFLNKAIYWTDENHLSGIGANRHSIELVRKKIFLN